VNPRLSLLTTAVAWLGLSVAVTTVRAEDPPRAVIVVSSADALIADLEHIVVDLAGKKKDWEDNVFPNIDIFLIGVDKSQPVRYDQIMAAEGGRREQLIVPIEKLPDFIKDNLDPIGIVVKKDRKDKDLYKLTGGVYDGWMRIKHNYAYFAAEKHQEDVPADIAAPDAVHAHLLKQGFDLAAELDNSKTTADGRRNAFATFRDNTLAGLQKRPDETNEAFALRKLSSEQSLETLERLFVESSLATIGWTTDSEKNLGTGKLVLKAEPNTPLAALLKLQGEKHSRFAGVPEPSDPVLKGRLNYALDETATRQFGELYKLLGPALDQRIDKTENITDEQKAARKELAGVLLGMLTSSLDLQRWDGFVQIVPQTSGKHTGIIGMSAKDGAPLAKALELLPKAFAGYTVDLKTSTTGDVEVHKVTITEDYPKAFQDFFGSNEIYVGTGPDSIWVSLGEGAVDALGSAVAAAAKAPEGKVDPTIAALDIDLLPVLKLTGQLRKDGDFDLMATLKSRGLLEEPPPEEEKKEGDEEKPGSDTANMLKNFEWRDAAIEALDSKADRLHMDIKRVEDHVDGTTTVESGILKAIGDIIAKFARENLG
jgi:hypothetical protein